MISILAVFQSYFYMYAAAFPPKEVSKLMIVIELIFTIDIGIKIFQLKSSYIKYSLFCDIVILFPFQFLKFQETTTKLFYMLKVLRFRNGFKLLNMRKMMLFIRIYFSKRLYRKIEINPNIADDNKGDHKKLDMMRNLF